jgi:hypothetical protein
VPAAGVTGHEFDKQEKAIRLKLAKAAALRSDHNDFAEQVRRKGYARFRVASGRERDPVWSRRNSTAT